MHSKDLENKGHVGTYLERTLNVLGTYPECIGKGIIKRRGCEEMRSRALLCKREDDSLSDSSGTSSSDSGSSDSSDSSDDDSSDTAR